jgi:hypothetical protein
MAGQDDRRIEHPKNLLDNVHAAKDPILLGNVSTVSLPRAVNDRQRGNITGSDILSQGIAKQAGNVLGKKHLIHSSILSENLRIPVHFILLYNIPSKKAISTMNKFRMLSVNFS